MRLYGYSGPSFGPMDMRIGTKSLLLAIGLTLAAMSPAAAFDQTTCKQTTDEEIKALFVRWNNDLIAGDARKIVLNNYASDAVLLPTASDVMATDRQAIVTYFATVFLPHGPVGEINDRVIKLGCNEAIDIGFYTFTYKKDNPPKIVPARYTFTYKWDTSQGKWLISTHHSSKVPE